MSQFNNSSHFNNDLPTAMFADCLANSKKIFELIDSIFPVDSCRHYQILPLNLEDGNLTLGMLNPENPESLKFINSIAKVFNYNLKLELIDDQTLEILLASYPQNHQKAAKQDRTKDRNQTVIDATIIEAGFDSNRASVTNDFPRKRLADSTPTIISQSEVTDSEPKTETPKGLEGLPPDLDFLKDLDLSPNSPSSASKAADPTATVYEIPAEFSHQQAKNNLDDKPTIIANDPAQLLAQTNAQNQSKIERDRTISLDSTIEINNSLQALDEDELETEDFLSQLTPQLSWQKLLEQAFKYHTEAIDLTRYSSYGSIVANKAQLPQSYLEQVPLPIFCSLIDEIKRMARIPLDLSNHPKKVVLERFYEQERILLRIEFTSQNQKQIVLVKILRGKNLQVYEQQQMDKVSEQALYLAKQLEKTLRKIQACFDTAEFTNLRELQAVQSRINHQLRLLDK